MLLSLSARTSGDINNYLSFLYTSMLLYAFVIVSTYYYALERIKSFLLFIARDKAYDLISSDHVLFIGYIGLMLCDVLYRLKFYLMFNAVDVYLAVDPSLSQYINMVAFIMTCIAILQNRVLAYDASSVKVCNIINFSFIFVYPSIYFAILIFLYIIYNFFFTFLEKNGN